MDYKIQLSILFSLFKQGNTYNIKNTISQQQQKFLKFFWHEKLQKKNGFKTIYFNTPWIRVLVPSGNLTDKLLYI